MSDREQDQVHRPALPDHYGLIGLAIGFALAFVYYRAVLEYVPDELYPLHMLALAPIVVLFLGAPALMERIYWWWADV